MRSGSDPEFHITHFFQSLFNCLDLWAAILYPEKGKGRKNRLPEAVTRALGWVLYADFAGTRASKRLSMLFSPFTTREKWPEERFKTGMLAISKLLRKSA